MARPSLPARDTTVLLVVFGAALVVMALSPPSTAPTGAPSAARVAGPNDPGTGAGGGGAGSTGGSGAGATTPSRASGASGSTTATGGATPPPTTRAATASGGGNRLDLMQSRYAKYAYRISDPSLSSGARRALDGFEWNRTRLNATAVRVTLTPDESRYQPYSAVVRSGQTLYFIETSFGDDAPRRENQLNDDAAVVVDKDGYVIQ